jgi:ankyrin repeat protein
MNTSIDRLFIAAWDDNLPEVERLLSVGANVNATDNGGWTPLFVACLRGHVQVVKELVDHRADLEANNNYKGDTPLHCASQHAHLPVVKALLSRGANIEAKNNSGDSHTSSRGLLGGGMLPLSTHC